MRTDGDRLLTGTEVAALFGVDPKTVLRWANQGRLTFVRTLGGPRQLGHRRYRESEVLGLLEVDRRPTPAAAPAEYARHSCAHPMDGHGPEGCEARGCPCEVTP